MAIWMAYALMVLILWGLTGVTQKLSTNYVSVSLTFVCYAAAYVPIAAIVLCHDATLISRNLSDFGRVPGLKVDDLTRP